MDQVLFSGSGLTVSINGMSYNGSNICVNNNRVFIDGVEQQSTLSTKQAINIVVDGDVEQLSCQGDVTVKGNAGGVQAGGDIRVSGNCAAINAGGDVRVNGNCAEINAGGDVRTG